MKKILFSSLLLIIIYIILLFIPLSKNISGINMALFTVISVLFSIGWNITLSFDFSSIKNKDTFDWLKDLLKRKSNNSFIYFFISIPVLILSQSLSFNFKFKFISICSDYLFTSFFVFALVKLALNYYNLYTIKIDIAKRIIEENMKK